MFTSSVGHIDLCSLLVCDILTLLLLVCTIFVSFQLNMFIVSKFCCLSSYVGLYAAYLSWGGCFFLYLKTVKKLYG